MLRQTIHSASIRWSWWTHLLEDYVALQPHQYVAVALWALHTHVFDRFM